MLTYYLSGYFFLQVDLDRGLQSRFLDNFAVGD